MTENLCPPKIKLSVYRKPLSQSGRETSELYDEYTCPATAADKLVRTLREVDADNWYWWTTAADDKAQGKLFWDRSTRKSEEELPNPFSSPLSALLGQ